MCWSEMKGMKVSSQKKQNRIHEKQFWCNFLTPQHANTSTPTTSPLPPLTQAGEGNASRDVAALASLQEQYAALQLSLQTFVKGLEQETTCPPTET